MSPDKLAINDNIWAYRVGRMVVVSLWECPIKLDGYYSEQTVATMPDGWKPKQATCAALTTNNTNINLHMTVLVGGAVIVSATSGGEPPGSNVVRGQVIYVTD